jgi:hypothetical protein
VRQEIEEGLGFKKLTAENWLQPDEVMLAFRHYSPVNGQFYVPEGDERVRD